jgi:hypothetical protein
LLTATFSFKGQKNVQHAAGETGGPPPYDFCSAFDFGADQPIVITAQSTHRYIARKYFSGIQMVSCCMEKVNFLHGEMSK